MDLNVAVGIGLGLALVVLFAAVTTDAVSEAGKVPRQLFRAIVTRTERLLRASTRASRVR